MRNNFDFFRGAATNAGVERQTKGVRTDPAGRWRQAPGQRGQVRSAGPPTRQRAAARITRKGEKLVRTLPIRGCSAEEMGRDARRSRSAAEASGPPVAPHPPTRTTQELMMPSAVARRPWPPAARRRELVRLLAHGLLRAAGASRNLVPRPSLGPPAG